MYRADSLRVLPLYFQERDEGIRGEGQLHRVLFDEVDDIVHMKTGFKPEQPLSPEIDVLARAIQLLGHR